MIPELLEGDGLESGRWYDPPPLATLLLPAPPPPELAPPEPAPLLVVPVPPPDPIRAGECPGPPYPIEGLPAPPRDGGKEPYPDSEPYTASAENERPVAPRPPNAFPDPPGPEFRSWACGELNPP